MNGVVDNILKTRTKQQQGYCYKLGGIGQFGLDTTIPLDMDFDESRMALRIPFASGIRRDNGGDLLDVEGIDTTRHRINPIVLLDHGKEVKLPIALAEDPDTHNYTVRINSDTKTADLLGFFYQGKGMPESDRNYEHALLCEQLYDMAVKRYIRGGSIGYLTVHAKQLPPDYQTGTPQGLHLIQVLMLEGSLVVMPMNQDTVRKALCVGKWCGKPLVPVLHKSLSVFAPDKKAFMGWESKGVTKETAAKLAKVGAELARHNNPAPMPGYGQIFSNEGVVWYVGGDGDEDGFPKVVERKIREAYPGVTKIIIEAESFPPEDENWIQVYPDKKDKGLGHDCCTGKAHKCDKCSSNGRKDMPVEVQIKGTEMPTETTAPGQEEEEHDYVPPNDVDDENGDEPFSSRMLRRMHDDAVTMLEDYDGWQGYLEHNELQEWLANKLKEVVAAIEDIEEQHEKHHPNLTRIDGIRNSPDEEEGVEGIEDEEAEPADSKMEEEPTGDEVVEGMRKEYRPRTKELATKYSKKSGDGKDPKDKPGNEEYQKKPGHERTSGPEGREHEPGYEENDPKPGREQSSEGIEGVHKPGDEEFKLLAHELGHVKDAHGFLGRASQSHELSDDDRMEAYHMHKNLGAISKSRMPKPMDVAGKEPVNDPAVAGGQKDMGMDDGMGMDGGEEEKMIHPWHKACKGASSFLKELSQTRNLMDDHRVRAVKHQTELSPMIESHETVNVQDPSSNPQDEVKMKRLGERLALQQKAVDDLNRKLAQLNGAIKGN